MATQKIETGLIADDAVTSAKIGTLDANLEFGDSVKAIFGAGSDLQIYHHPGGNSIIAETGTGDLFVQATNIQLEDASGNNMIFANSGGAVNLYHNAGEKLATTSTGIDVTGTATMDGLTVDGTSDLNGNVTIGTSITTLLSGNDIDFQRAGDSYLSQTGGGSLFIRTNDGTSNKVRLNVSPIGDISFYEDTGTTAKLFWDASAESLGIGTSNPLAPLHVGGEAYFNAGTRHYTYDDQANFWSLYTNTDDSFRFNYNGSGDDEVVIKTDGNVGIGTSSPLQKLVVSDGGGYGFEFAPNNSSVNQILSYDRSGGAYRDFKISANEIRLGYGQAGANEAMRIDSSGNVGIGTSSPSSFSSGADNLVVGTGSGDNGITLYSGTTSVSRLHFADGTGSGGQYDGFIIYDHNLQAMSFGTGATGGVDVTLDSSGDLLVGKTNFSLTTAGVMLAPNGGSEFVSQGNNNTVLNIASADDTYISLVGFFTAGGTQCGYILGNGSAVSLVSLSDYRLKEDWQPIANATQTLMQLKPYNFAWKADGSRTDGFLAHELQEVVPTAAHGVKDELDSDGNPKYQGIDQSKLVPLLTKAIQEQQTIIDDLKARLDEAGL